LIDFRKERHGYAALCTCGVIEHGLLNRAEADAWVVLHGAYVELAKSWDES
jgi:hypothetical protein